eukprot:CAMPEP_0180594868 /NCGR_PEP_ID=MMETSP1037_2-20121125/20999_1 /TAXON_ID=632150 /ORGANISM="Azadinium spinosum, Strain 3D9" /LENGTH=35 /DNA_ID= /DNA_START= /DNA_END= /DNA_ORIENTATION=
MVASSLSCKSEKLEVSAALSSCGMSASTAEERSPP